MTRTLAFVLAATAIIAGIGCFVWFFWLGIIQRSDESFKNASVLLLLIGAGFLLVGFTRSR